VQQRVVVARNNWKVFGPSAEYSDGDAEYFRLTSQLSDQYEWFAPRQGDEDASVAPEQEEGQQQQRVIRPEFGLSPREIAALGLSGTRSNLPDPVRVRGGAWSEQMAQCAKLLHLSRSPWTHACVFVRVGAGETGGWQQLCVASAHFQSQQRLRHLQEALAHAHICGPAVSAHRHTTGGSVNSSNYKRRRRQHARKQQLHTARPLTPAPASPRFALQSTLSAKHYMRGDPFNPADPASLGFSATLQRGGAAGASSSSGGGGAAAATMARGRAYSGARAAYGDYQAYPEGRPIFMPEAERFGNPPDLPSLLLQQRVIYISMPVWPCFGVWGGYALVAYGMSHRRTSRGWRCSVA
jgi:hypothetical protein